MSKSTASLGIVYDVQLSALLQDLAHGGHATLADAVRSLYLEVEQWRKRATGETVSNEIDPRIDPHGAAIQWLHTHGGLVNNSPPLLVSGRVAAAIIRGLLDQRCPWCKRRHGVTEDEMRIRREELRDVQF